MRRTLAALMLLFSAALSAQKFGGMEPNRYTYISAGAAYPYVGVKVGYEIQQDVFIEVQALTDGGGIWKENVFNDWRSLSFVRALSIESLHSEFRAGMGIVQSEERLTNQRANSFGIAPQVGYTLFLHRQWAASSSITWPLSPASNLTPGILFSIEYRIGCYEKENGLH
ncbi:MAG: hypothetical protein ACPG53_00890 [Schleiferiaceae bacterium]